ncbi:hypothetical protein [Dehalococcoides mccartyi]|jgi:hypothetical protein|uniref:hypothetical protein n=1 Tax=Dehalococcoides mccartyi TaxID=61435 RepID=UPI0012947035|nr:hypothetical protein [Dehalococcoides mccartyi]
MKAITDISELELVEVTYGNKPFPQALFNEMLSEVVKAYMKDKKAGEQQLSGGKDMS